MPDHDLKAVAAELRRVAGFLDGYARSGDEPPPEVLAAGAAQLMHLAAGLMGADAVGVTFGQAGPPRE